MDRLIGRVVELSGSGASARLSVSAGLIYEVQRAGDPVVWISMGSIFYPPDFVANGIDLAALIVLRLGTLSSALRASDKVIRSGGFPLVILDGGTKAHSGSPPSLQSAGIAPAGIAPAVLARLAGLCQRYQTALVVLTSTSATSPSLGSLISLRGVASRRRLDITRPGESAYTCAIEIARDKQHGSRDTYVKRYDAPAGLY